MSTQGEWMITSDGGILPVGAGIHSVSGTPFALERIDTKQGLEALESNSAARMRSVLVEYGI
jgi:hypothetical protein